MGINSTATAWNFGQLGSGHLRANATDLTPPHGRVIVAITMLEDIQFDQLVAVTDGASADVDDSDSYGDGVAFFGSQTQTRANGLDQSDDSAESESVGTGVIFPEGLTIYGRWNRVSLNDDYTHGVIVYYGY